MMTRMTSDVNQAQTGVNMALRLLLRSPFVVLGAMVMAFTIDAKCALIFVAVIGALSLVVYAIMAANIPMMAGVQRQLEAVLAATRENLAGVRVIQAVGGYYEELIESAGEEIRALEESDIAPPFPDDEDEDGDEDDSSASSASSAG
jgi:ABC-type multidrug transport system fused ATPase/permease subunit